MNQNPIMWLYKSPARLAVALRTAAQTFAGVLIAAWFADGDGRASTLDDVVASQADLAAGSAIAALIITLGWHARRGSDAAA